MGVEVQNTVKAIYCADFLAGAGWYDGERKDGRIRSIEDRADKRRQTRADHSAH